MAPDGPDARRNPDAPAPRDPAREPTSIPSSRDPLAVLLADAAAGSFPIADGSVTVLPPDTTTGLHAVLSFTSHAVVMTDRTRSEILATGIDAYGGATDPAVLLAIAGQTHRCGVLDATLVRRGTGPRAADPTRSGATAPIRTGSEDDRLVETTRHDDHPRVRYARTWRRDVRVFADSTGLVTFGHGLGGRLELGVELVETAGGAGRGASLVRRALDLVGSDRWLFAACAPGNARSLRSLLGAGFVPIGSEVLMRPVDPASDRDGRAADPPAV